MGRNEMLKAPDQSADAKVLDLLDRAGPLSVAQLIEETSVTATAVRQRLSRLMAAGLVKRELARTSEGAGRGRPGHVYAVTEKARRNSGSNFADLAIALWLEVRKISDPEVRRGLLDRLSTTLERLYGPSIQGMTTADRMRSLAGLFADRNVEFKVEGSEQLPVLTAVDCPYPQLVERDGAICAVERLLFSKLLSTKVRLSQCRLDGTSCCRFETN
jgi:predicted ArsR family transcriptional regulator